MAKVTRRELLRLGAAAAAVTATRAAAGGPGGSSPRSGRPNVVLVLTDDQGWGDVHIDGNEMIRTPVQDRLAEQGARFERFFVCPLCAPTRASVLTGRYHMRTGVSGVTGGKEIMRSKEVTVAEVLKRAGYATGCFGKWHNGSYWPFCPNAQGFDEFFGFCAGHWNNYFDTTLEHNGREVRTKGYITDVLTDAAIAFIRANRDKPFFCYVPYNAPHSPFQVPEKYWRRFEGKGLDPVTRCVYAMVENIDDNLGRICSVLDELKLTGKTVVIFLTDNGPNGKRFNGGMAGRKGSTWEGGTRVPCFVRWPGHIRPGTVVRRIAAHIDLLPTIAEMCGVEPAGTLPLDGRSLLGLLTGRAGNWPDRMLFERQAVRTQRWRLQLTGRRAKLFDMPADGGQKKDVAAEHPDVVRRLSRAYEAWYADVRKGLAGMPPPLPVGYPQRRVVTLLAPESSRTGGVRFKQGRGWANDWLVNWKSTDDRIWWDIDVVRDGRFAVTLLYTCPPQDVGSKIRVEAAGQAVEGVLNRPHDPKYIFSPDRVPRKEVYEKVWAPLELGTLQLPAGRTKLTLRATKVPGRQVCELKAVRLRRMD
ncbi:MAG: arylsulfatase [Planctomycetes bacterium]|nr:arylsulfatase [Planctomycetota bacterium]